MTDDTKLELAPRLHIGARIDLTDPVLKDYGARISTLAGDMRAQVNMLEHLKREVEGMKEIFWARLHELLPATKEWNMRMDSDGTNVVVAGPNGDDGCGCGILGGGAMPESLKKAIAKAFGKGDGD